mgnify:CR=1 FL=1
MKRYPSQEKAWMKYFPEEAQNLQLPQMTVYSFMKEINKDNMDGNALDYYGTKITYGQLVDRIEETAKAFTALGVKEGDLVSFVSVGIPETIAAIYALNKLGATANMIDPRMDIKSIGKMISKCGSRITVVIDIAYPKLDRVMDLIHQDHIITQSAARSLPTIKRIAMKLATRTRIPYGKHGLMKWDDFLAGGQEAVAVEAPYMGDRTVAITHTGGTTGFPKGVMLTNDSMNAVASNFLHTGIYYHKGDRFLGIIPVFTSYGMVCGLHMPFCMNCELIPIPKFVPTELGKLVKQFRPNHMISTPAFYELMMDSKEMKGLDLSFLITMGSGGDTMNEGLEKKLGEFMREHNIRYPLAQGYGMSEVSAAASFGVNDIYRKGSVGIPSVLTTVGIFDPDSEEELGYHQVGEICITGPTMMKGYFRNPEETAYTKRQHADGEYWIHSGDLGYLDEDGFLFVVGRMKRMITRFDGHKVFPVNIESMVNERADVGNCCVIGVDDRGHGQGQYPLVITALAEGVDKRTACKNIFDACQVLLEERGKPVAVLPVDAIPLTGSGKNDYRKLEEEYSTYDYTQWDPEKL